MASFVATISMTILRTLALPRRTNFTFEPWLLDSNDVYQHLVLQRFDHRSTKRRPWRSDHALLCHRELPHRRLRAGLLPQRLGHRERARHGKGTQLRSPSRQLEKGQIRS
jgi:hypothetical protein